jgi:hypothetical protein
MMWGKENDNNLVMKFKHLIMIEDDENSRVGWEQSQIE